MDEDAEYKICVKINNQNFALGEVRIQCGMFNVFEKDPC